MLNVAEQNQTKSNVSDPWSLGREISVLMCMCREREIAPERERDIRGWSLHTHHFTLQHSKYIALNHIILQGWTLGDCEPPCELTHTSIEV